MFEATSAVPEPISTPASGQLALVKLRPGVGNVEIAEVPEPECRPGCVKIEVAFSGICGTDIHVYHDRFRNFPPVILGHEFSGTVVEVGCDVATLACGDRVTVLGSTAVVCGKCEFCRAGYYMFCSIRRGMGHGVDGAFTRFVTVRDDQAYRLPANVSLEEGALAEPFASAVQGIEELTDFHPGDTVLVSGPGPIGLLCLSLLVAHNCRVIVAGTDVDELRLALAMKLGADLTVNVDTEDLPGIVEHETGGRGVDAVIECAGVQDSIVNALTVVRQRGRYVQMGIVGEDVSVPFDTILYKNLRVFGSLGHSLQSWDHVLRIFGQGKIDLKPIITHIMPLSKWQKAFDLCVTKQCGKVLLHYDIDFIRR